MLIMKRNEGSVDQVLRVVAGLILLSLVFIGPKTLWGLVGLVPLLTGIAGYCPLYQLLGISTCPLKRP
jgi:hypothetical protein